DQSKKLEHIKNYIFVTKESYVGITDSIFYKNWLNYKVCTCLWLDKFVNIFLFLKGIHHFI
ncbi:MAG: hypothetical protein ACI9OE_002698, partial [Mariniflexile sp.]